MLSIKFLAPILALAGAANAASCTVSATTTIQNKGDATAIAASCSTFSGSIAVATGTTDPIDLSGIRRISGNLVVTNVSQITSLQSSDLEQIDGTFMLNDDQILSSLSFPRLSRVNVLQWSGLPNLGSITFTTGLQSAGTIDIRNTFLSDLQGIISVKSVATFYLANNKFLNSLSLELKNISTALTLEDNGDKMLATFPNLEWANNMTFRNCPNVSVPALQSTNGSFGFYENTLQTLSANNLTSVGGSFSIVTNTALSSLALPALTSVGGGFQIANNTALDSISLPALQTVGGALDFYGNFSQLSMPALKDIKGAFNVQSSSSDITDACTNFKKESGSNNVIKGKFVCQGSVAKPGGQGTTPTTTSSSGSKTSAGASARQYSLASVFGVAGLLAALISMV